MINRAFCIGSGVMSKENVIQSKINTNKSLLLKTLYDINSDAVLKCFSKNIQNKQKTAQRLNDDIKKPLIN